jgi:dienelactone hydrolase
MKRVTRPGRWFVLCTIPTAIGLWCDSRLPLRADEAPLVAALAEPILAEGQPLQEARAFIEPRIIKLAPFSDRAKWEQAAGQLRRDMLEQVVFRGSAAQWHDQKCRVEWLDTIAGGPGYRIRKFRYEALSGMWLPGLLYLPDNLAGRVPVAVHVNGHAPEGKAVNYKQLRSINLAKRGMLVLNLEWFGMGQLRTSGFSHYRMNQLDLCGASGLAPFYLALERGLDVAVALEHADAKRVAVSGLSGGGWQTILISSLDERVALANPVAGYGSFRTNILFDDMGDSEQSPTDMGIVADFTHLTAMRAPRPTLLTYNASDDCCFKSGHTLAPLLEAAGPIFALYGSENKLRSHVNHDPGTHNFERENREQYYAALGDYFYPNDKQFIRAEIPSEAELKAAEELNVPLPSANLDFHTLAVKLVAELPRERALPIGKADAESWQRGRRERLKALLRVPRYEVTASTEKAKPTGKVDEPAARVTARKLKIGNDWTLPAVEIAPASKPNSKTALLVADAGRATVAAEAQRLAAEGFRVLAVDLLAQGESKVKAQDPDFLYPLFIAAVGERPLGIQAAELAAVARWLQARGAKEAVTIVGIGPRSGTAALVAAAIDPEAIVAVELSGSLASFAQLIEEDKTVESSPELFAFGLLAEFDIRELAALAAPRPVTFREPSERARHELAPLEAWYALWGVTLNPAR